MERTLQESEYDVASPNHQPAPASFPPDPASSPAPSSAGTGNGGRMARGGEGSGSVGVDGRTGGRASKAGLEVVRGALVRTLFAMDDYVVAQFRPAAPPDGTAGASDPGGAQGATCTVVGYGGVLSGLSPGAQLELSGVS